MVTDYSKVPHFELSYQREPHHRNIPQLHEYAQQTHTLTAQQSTHFVVAIVKMGAVDAATWV